MENEIRKEIDDNHLEVENVVVTEEKKEDTSFSIGDAIVFIVIMALAGWGLWEGGTYIVQKAIPQYVMPLISDATMHTKRISPDLEFRSYQYRKDGYIARTGSDEKLLDHVDWIHVGQDRDSLAVYSRYGKRGYINRFTGELAIPAVYTRAWVFSEGRAAVVKDNRLKFIDHTGKTIIDRNLSIGKYANDFVFKDGHCMVYDAVTGKAGLIGKDGEWLLPAEWECLYDYGHLWACGRDGIFGLYHTQKGMVLEPVYQSLHIEDDEVIVHGPDNVVSRYDHEGNLLTDLIIESVEPLIVSTQKIDMTISRDEVCCVMAVADCKLYWVDTNCDGRYCGLMDRNGNCITKPLYRQIEAISSNRYLVWPQGIILDSNGKQVDYYRL